MRFLRYVFIQCSAYAIDMGGFALLILYSGSSPLWANIAGKLAAGVFAFALHRLFTFGSREQGRVGQQAIRYFALLTLNIPLSAFILDVLLWLVPNVLIAKFLADAICLTVTYWLTSRFVFLGGSEASGEEICSRSGQ